MKTKDLFKDKLKRREVLRKGMGALGIAGLAGSSLAPSMFGRVAEAAASAAANGKILVILELSGGNDGLNTVVPYGANPLQFAVKATSLSCVINLIDLYAKLFMKKKMH